MGCEQQVPLGSPFGAKSEPKEVLDGFDLGGKVAIVTGGYSGIGLETTRSLAAKGMTVIVPARDPNKASKNLSGIEGDIRKLSMDLADLESVQRFVDALEEQFARIDLLINNAGVMACPLERVGPGWESQFGVNHMGHFALTKALMPMIERAEAPRVVALSSVGHRRNGIDWDDIHFERRDYDKWTAYAQAKSANALFANALARRLAPSSGRAYSVHPGGIFTPLQRHLPTEEQIALGWLGDDGEPSALARDHFKTPEQGASTTLWAATSPLLESVNGVYCEDCDVAPLNAEEGRGFAGCAPHICDDAAAERLWEMSEAMLADALSGHG